MQNTSYTLRYNEIQRGTKEFSGQIREQFKFEFSEKMDRGKDLKKSKYVPFHVSVFPMFQKSSNDFKPSIAVEIKIKQAFHW